MPHSGMVAGFNANASRPLVPNCVPLQRGAAHAPAGAGGPNPIINPTPGSGASSRPANTAGRRLLQDAPTDPTALTLPAAPVPAAAPADAPARVGAARNPPAAVRPCIYWLMLLLFAPPSTRAADIGLVLVGSMVVFHVYSCRSTPTPSGVTTV